MVTPPRTPSTEMGREEHRGCSSSTGPTSEQQTGLSVPQLAFTHSLCHRANGTMKDEVALLATVTLLGVLLQAYFSLQVISARRAFRVSPPLTTGPPEFERVYRAQGGGPVRPGLPVRAPSLLPGLRALRAAQVRTGRGAGRGRGKIAGGRGSWGAGPKLGAGHGPEPSAFGDSVGEPWRRPEEVPVGPGLRRGRSGASSRHLPADRRPQAGTPVRERARPLAAGGAGCARPARPLPPGRAARRAPRTAPDAAAVGLRPRPPGRRSRERRAGASRCPGEGRSLPHPSLYH
ncbi:leukotriene C4 synthase isoform X2 [Symphalangus syndactylus]|uniref:leukotriene C4 synthase isoform X2 n=1 Tax=Symphalangus syndactylus TaxID=9590 RepID=UPI0024432363|nr:leukotriene C4 synthase isoform X1 [Symphalangus syndactylus]